MTERETENLVEKVAYILAPSYWDQGKKIDEVNREKKRVLARKIVKLLQDETL